MAEKGSQVLNAVVWLCRAQGHCEGLIIDRSRIPTTNLISQHSLHHTIITLSSNHRPLTLLPRHNSLLVIFIDISLNPIAPLQLSNTEQLIILTTHDVLCKHHRLNWLPLLLQQLRSELCEFLLKLCHVEQEQILQF